MTPPPYDMDAPVPLAVEPVTLTDFLLARIAEDEARARRFFPQEALRVHFSGDAEPTVLYTAARVLAECEAKRRIVELHTPDDWRRYAPDSCPSCADSVGHLDSDWEDYPCPTLHALAAVYSDHPDYREVWRA